LYVLCPGGVSVQSGLRGVGHAILGSAGDNQSPSARCSRILLDLPLLCSGTLDLKLALLGAVLWIRKYFFQIRIL
jgi:hypothetical protein